MIRLPLFFFILLLISSPASADRITMYADAAATDCALAYDTPGVVNIYVIAQAPQASAVQFSAPLPDCWTGVTYMNETVPAPYIRIGNSQDGVAIAFGTCVGGWNIHVLTIQVFVSNPDLVGDCCHYGVQPDPTADPPGMYIMDCGDPPALQSVSGGDVFITRSGGWEAPDPANPYPPDGALDQALDLNLEWDVILCSCGLGVVLHDVYFGTDPNPPRVARFHDAEWYDPGVLQPETVYYWKIVAMDTDGGTTTGPVWAFRTEAAIPIERSTWGKIKSLYE